jgi:hypothetical protein
MNENCPKNSEQRLANLNTLQRQLQDLGDKRKSSGPTPKQQADRAQGPVLVIRGK